MACAPLMAAQNAHSPQTTISCTDGISASQTGKPRSTSYVVPLPASLDYRWLPWRLLGWRHCASDSHSWLPPRAPGTSFWRVFQATIACSRITRGGPCVWHLRQPPQKMPVVPARSTCGSPPSGQNGQGSNSSATTGATYLRSFARLKLMPLRERPNCFAN